MGRDDVDCHPIRRKGVTLGRREFRGVQSKGGGGRNLRVGSKRRGGSRGGKTQRLFGVVGKVLKGK